MPISRKRPYRWPRNYNSVAYKHEFYKELIKTLSQTESLTPQHLLPSAETFKDQANAALKHVVFTFHLMAVAQESRKDKQK